MGRKKVRFIDTMNWDSTDYVQKTLNRANSYARSWSNLNTGHRGEKSKQKSTKQINFFSILVNNITILFLQPPYFRISLGYNYSLLYVMAKIAADRLAIVFFIYFSGRKRQAYLLLLLFYAIALIHQVSLCIIGGPILSLISISDE